MHAGLQLKAAADRAGKPIYLEMSSVNPVFVLPGALKERAEAIAQGMNTSFTMGVGQFCTKPGLVFALGGDDFDRAAAGDAVLRLAAGGQVER